MEGVGLGGNTSFMYAIFLTLKLLAEDFAEKPRLFSTGVVVWIRGCIADFNVLRRDCSDYGFS